jgi:virginiamycin B lyase
MKRLVFAIILIPLLSFSQKDSIKIVDIDQAAFKTLLVGEHPDFMAAESGHAWVIDDHQNRILKISPYSNSPLFVVHVQEACTAPIIGFDAVWVMSCKERSLYKIDDKTGKVLAKIKTGISDPNGEMSLANGGGSVWLLSDSTGVLLRIDPKTNTVQKRIKVRHHSYCAAYGHHSIWISNSADNTVQKIDTKTNSVTSSIPVGSKPRFLTAGGEYVWTLNQGDGTVSKIDPSSDKLLATINVKAVGGGGDISSDSRNVWVVSTNAERPVQTINAKSNKIETVYREQTTAGNKVRVDGAVRLSENYIWISGYYRKKIWILKK